MTTTIIRIVVFTTLLSATTAAWSRTWTDSTGKFKIEAELEKVAGGTVTLRKKNGTTIDIAIKRLSKADQAFIAAEKQHQECPMEVVGYLITDVLQGGLGTTGGRIRPKGKSARFVVIVVKLPRGELIPSESSYKVLVRRKPKKDRRPRENMQEFDPGRFTIYWDKKSKRTGHLMSNWILAEKPGEQPKGTIIGFSAGFSSSTEQVVDPKKVDTLAIAWVMSAAAAHPPFRIQFDKYAPHEVPDRKIKPLPIKSFGF